MRIAVVEDEKSYQDLLCGYIEKYKNANHTVIQVETFSGGQEIVDWYGRTEGFDIIFLDIEMSTMDGMEAARRIREKDTDAILIYITNMAQYAVKGYEVEALDFIVKPVGYEIFEAKMNKAWDRIENRRERYIVIKNKKGILRLRVREILYVEVANHSLIYHTSSGSYTCTGSLGQVEKELGNSSFSRCSACYLVNLRHIERVEKDAVIMANGDRLGISRTKKTTFMERLTDYYGGR